MAERKSEQTREEWLASRPQREAAAQQRDAARKAAEARALRVNEELDQELAAEAEDPGYRRRKTLKSAIVKRIERENEPVLRSKLYKSFNADRYREAFGQAIQELLEAETIIQTDSRRGIHGMIGKAYVLAPR